MRKLQEEAVRLEHEKIVKQAAEDLILPSLLSRKRRRSAEKVINVAELEQEALEQGKIVAQAKEQLKQPKKLSRNQKREAEDIIAQAVEKKKFLRNKSRATKEAAKEAKHESDNLDTLQKEKHRHIATATAHPSKKAIKQGRHGVELELSKPEMVSEQQWIKFNVDRAIAEERTTRSLEYHQKHYFRRFGSILH